MTRPTTTLPTWIRAGASTRPLATTRWTSSRCSTIQTGTLGPRKARSESAASRRTAAPPRMRKRQRRTVGDAISTGVYGTRLASAASNPRCAWIRRCGRWSTTGRRTPGARPGASARSRWPARAWTSARTTTTPRMVIVKPRFAGFCGSDRGIWFRRAFGDMISSRTLAADGEGRTGHRPRAARRGRRCRPRGAPRLRARARRHRVDREPHHLRQLLPVPHRRHPRLRRPTDHRHQRGRLLRRVREAAGPGALAHRHAQDPPRGGRACRSLSATPCTPAPR